MELVENSAIKMISRHSLALRDYDNNCDEDVEDKQNLSMAEQFYYEVISSFQKEEEVFMRVYTGLLYQFIFQLFYRFITFSTTHEFYRFFEQPKS